MRVALLAIGDEIVAGTTTDTNSGFISGLLREVGAEAVAGFAVPDDEAAITQALERALDDAELVVCTGGLGPTADDLTTAVVGHLAGGELWLDQPSLEAIAERFRSRGVEMTPNNRKQAYFPRGASVIPNPNGTAPGFLVPLQRGGRACWIACFPGVPREMRAMVQDWLLPWVAGQSGDTRFAARTFSVFGLSESKLDELLVGVVAADEARLAFRAAFPRIQARLTVRGGAGDDLERRLDALEARVRERLGHHLYAVGDRGMEDAVGELLRARGLTLAVAESCTGGRIGDWLTNVPGSSEYFLLGVSAYSNAAKQRLLRVSEATLAAHGAVSTQVAEEMARGAREASGASLGLSTTGIAGPGGGTAEKPVGTVCVGLAWEGGAWSRRYDLGDRGRDWVKGFTALIALDRARRWLLGVMDDA